MSLRTRRRRLEVNGLNWGTITNTNPLTVTPDGSTTGLKVNINAAGASPRTSDRVMWTLAGRQVVLIADPRPAGELLFWSTTTGPGPLWVLASGNTIADGTYPRLEAVWAADSWPWGRIDASHYSLPPFHDGSGRFPRAQDPPGATGGAANHSHVVTGHVHSSAAHNHGLSPANGQAQVGGGTNQIAMNNVATSSWTDSRVMTGLTQAAGGTSRVTGVGLTGNTDNATPGNTGSTAGTTDSQSNLPQWAGVKVYVKVA